MQVICQQGILIARQMHSREHRTLQLPQVQSQADVNKQIERT